MKTLGMIGGVSTEATLIYYKTINAKVRDRLGSYNSADMRIHSVNFELYNGAHETRDWLFIRNGFDTAAALGVEQADIVSQSAPVLPDSVFLFFFWALDPFPLLMAIFFPFFLNTS